NDPARREKTVVSTRHQACSRGSVTLTRLSYLILILLAVPAAPLRAQDPSPDPQAQKPPDRMFGVLPNHGTVEDPSTLQPITTAERFRIASLNTFDPFVYPFVAFTAGLADIRGQEPTWNHGARGYGKHYAAAFSDNAIGNMMSTAVLPTLFHQDPRYIVLRSGGVWHRMAYAASRGVVTRGGGGRAEFNVSEIGGNGIGAALSNL